jgi:hypothetical protein
LKPTFFPNPKELRVRLEDRHETATESWVGYFEARLLLAAAAYLAMTSAVLSYIKIVANSTDFVGNVGALPFP